MMNKTTIHHETRRGSSGDVTGGRKHRVFLKSEADTWLGHQERRLRKRSKGEMGERFELGNFIWNIADDVLRDVYVRGKYRDVILPMTVIRRLDAVLEPTKDAVLTMKAQLDKAGVANQHAALCQASGEAFSNTSQFRLRDLASRPSSAAEGRLRGVSRRLLAERSGGAGQVQVPQPDPHARGGRRPRFPARKVSRSIRQSEPKAGAAPGRKCPAARSRQPFNGHDLRGTHSTPSTRRTNEEAGEHFTRAT